MMDITQNGVIKMLIAVIDRCIAMNANIDGNAPILAGSSNNLANMKNNMLWNDFKEWVTGPAVLFREIARKNNISEVQKVKIVSRENNYIQQAQFRDGSEIWRHYSTHENVALEENKSKE
jgi:hypothetical protein